jgi:CheY-like chemotaxis protein
VFASNIHANQQKMEDYKKKILMIDDDIDDQEIFLQIINQIDPSILCLQPASTSLAFDLLLHDNFIPHYIFLDVNMPVMNGFEFLKELKGHLSLSRIPVIIYTTSNEMEDWEKAKLMGADGFLTKDSSMKELRASLTQLLQFDRASEIFRGE